MRTTVNLDDDVTAAVEELRRQQGLGLSEAINRLARAGLAHRSERKRYEHHSADLGASRVDVRNIGEVLDFLDQPG